MLPRASTTVLADLTIKKTKQKKFKRRSTFALNKIQIDIATTSR